MAQAVAVGGVEKQESAAARAYDLAADRAILAAKLIPPVDAGVAHALRAALFVLPMLVHELTEELRFSLDQRLLAAVSELLDEVQVAQHLFVVLLRLGLLVPKDGAGVSGKAGEKQEQVVLQVEHGIHAQLERLRGDLVVFVELKAGDAAERGDVLVLLANGFLQQVDLDVARELGQLMRQDEP